MGALSSEGANSLTIDGAQYREAFDAAAHESKLMGYEIVLVDRSNGVIQSAPRHAGGILEPWRIDNDGVSGATGNTIANRRRRIRIEFIPAGMNLDSAMGEGVLKGAAIPGSTAALERFDLQTASGPIEMRVWVYIERSFREGSKPSSYSGTLASNWTNPLNNKPSDAIDESVREVARWTPMGRDTDYERTLTGRIAAAFQPPAPPSTELPRPPPAENVANPTP